MGGGSGRGGVPYRYLDRHVDIWRGLPERHLLAQWVLAANRAWGVKSISPLPRHLERQLAQAVPLDEVGVTARVHKLGVLHRLDKHALPTSATDQRRAYNFARDGRLELTRLETVQLRPLSISRLSFRHS